MDFFAHQEAARRSTRWLVAYFSLAVAAIVLAVYLAARLIFSGILVKTGEDVPSLWDLNMFLIVAGATLGVIVIGSLYKTIALRQGGDAVAWMLGGRLIDPDTRDLAERRLLNVVEEMAIASGVPVPQVYVLDKEKAINAFAAGYSPQDAVIGVTDGTLRLLDRDELQGVIAHEFSHLLNGDMRLNLRLIGVLHGILVIALIGYTVLRSLRFTGGSSGRGKKGGGGGALILAVLLFALTLMAVGWIGVFFGRLIKSAVSRQREFLADAASVQFTRNPSGLSEALQKIGGYGAGSRLRTPKAEEASHMFFGDAMKKRMFASQATHPPLDERIRRIDPGWSGSFPEIRYPEPAAARPEDKEQATPIERASALAGAAVAAVAAARRGEDPKRAAEAAYTGTEAITPDSVAERVGTLSDAHLAYAKTLLDSLPAAVREAAREPEGAEALVYTLLLDRDPAVRDRQLALLRERAEPAAVGLVGELSEPVAACPVAARLPLIDLALPALSRLSLGRHEAFLAAVEGLVAADEEIDLFEYTLQRLLASHLVPRYHPRAPQRPQYYRLKQLGGECSLLLSALAHSGHASAEQAGRAFDRAAAELPEGIDGLGLAPRAECGMAAVDAALAELDQTTPKLKRELVRAATAAVAFDGRVTVAEGELLRAVADSLGCPVPPFLPGQTAA